MVISEIAHKSKKKPKSTTSKASIKSILGAKSLKGSPKRQGRAWKTMDERLDALHKMMDDLLVECEQIKRKRLH